MDELSNEVLFDSALSDEQPEVTTEVVTEGDTRARDEQGRFVEKPIEPEPKPEVEAAKPVETKEAVESPGVRQLREALERSNRRADELERRFIATQPKPEAAPKPDIFEKPDEFVRSNVQEAVAPLQQQFSTFIESVSRRDAVREHGQETVTEAFKTLDQAASAGDPQALAVVQAVKKSMEPYQEIVSWYRGNEASRNPDAFFQRKLEESLKDEKFVEGLRAKLAPEEKPKPVFNVPPSLSRAASAATSSDVGDMSNEYLFENALR